MTDINQTQGDTQVDPQGDNVVSLLQRLANVSFPAISQVDAYWEALRGDRMMPERSEVDPRGLESALEFAFMLEHVAPGVGRVRIAGMHLNNLLGMEVRGMPITAFFEPEDRARFGRLLDRVVKTPGVAELRMTSPRGIGRPEVESRLYLAPLGNGGSGHPRILGCLQSEGEIGRAPRRFKVDHAQLRRLTGTMPAPQQPEVVRAKDTPRMNELAEAAAEFRHAPKSAKTSGKFDGVDYLRLVKTDD